MILDATIANGSYKTVASIDMPRNAHALMQNTYHLGYILPRPIHDDMRTDKVKLVCVWQSLLVCPSCGFRPSSTRASFSLLR